MKSNQEIAASVFEKSKIILQKRAERQKITAAAASSLAAVIIAVAAVKTHSSPENIPVQRTPDFQAASQLYAPVSDNDTRSSPSSKQNKKNTSHQNESVSESRRSISDNNALVKIQSSSSLKSQSSSKPKEKNNTVSNTAAYDNTSSDMQDTDSNTKSQNTRSNASEATSSKHTNSHAASSNTKASSSKSNTSKTTRSETSDSKTSSPAAGSSSLVNSDSDKITDTESTLSIISDVEQENPSPAVYPSPEDAELAEKAFYTVSFNENEYTSVEELTQSADKAIIGTVEHIEFISMFKKFEFLKDNIVKPTNTDMPQSESDNIYGDIITVYFVNVESTLSGDAGEGDDIRIFAYGGKPDMYVQEQSLAVGNSEYIPVVRNMPPINEGETYVFLLKEQNGYAALLNYTQSVYSEFTAKEIIEAFR